MLNLTGITQQPAAPLTDEQVARLQTIQTTPGKPGLFVITGIDGQTTGDHTGSNAQFMAAAAALHHSPSRPPSPPWRRRA